jgi:pyruvate/2-oxoglutarate dehydrogenase complex dihydrolipoamide acyltransferase (E2) component
MTTETAAHVIPKGQPVEAREGGAVAWRVGKGARVTKYQVLASIGDLDITAPAAGHLTALMFPEGATVAAGAIVAYVTPQRPVERPQAPESHNTPQAPAAPQERPQAEPGEAIEDRSPRRRGSHVAPLEVVPIVEPAPAASKPRRKRTKNRTYSIGEHQEAGIARLAKALQLEALDNPEVPAVNESELVRAAVEMLLDLPRPALMAILKANREGEKRGKWGRGRPRPLKR